MRTPSLFEASQSTEEKIVREVERLVGTTPKTKVHIVPADCAELQRLPRRRASKYWPEGIANL
jgi:hypothetical protein